MVAQVMHLPHLFELPELFEVAALCDLSPGTVQAVGAKYGIRRTFSDYREMLERADLDAVMVLTQDHAQPATDALRAGKHVFIEKPMCHNLDEADELLDAQAQSGCVAQLGHHKIYDPGYVAGRERIRQMQSPHLIRLYDINGPNDLFLEHYDIVRVDDVDAAEKERMGRLRDEGLQRAIGVQPEAVMRAYGKMLGLSIHDIYILDGAFGLPERVVSTEIWDGGGAFVSILAYPNNLRCILDTAGVPRPAALRRDDDGLFAGQHRVDRVSQSVSEERGHGGRGVEDGWETFPRIDDHRFLRGGVQAGVDTFSRLYCEWEDAAYAGIRRTSADRAVDRYDKGLQTIGFDVAPAVDTVSSAS